MRTGSEGLRLRVFVHESMRFEHQALYTAIVALARRERLATAVVFRAVEGFGQHQHLHTTRLVDIADDLPMIVEIVDTAEAIRAFVPLLDDIIPHGTAAVSAVRIVRYRRGRSA